MTTVNSLMAKNIGNAMTNIKTWGGVMYNVLDEGLRGGGTVDDTNALQALINKAVAAGRRTIFFPHGENGLYYVTSLVNADKVDFVGDNASFVGGYSGTISGFGSDAALKADLANTMGIFVDDYPGMSGETDDTGRVSRAMAAAVEASLPVRFSAKTYVANIQATSSDVHLIGSGRPIYDPISGDLIGGTIIKGMINLNGYKRCSVSRLGVDSRGALGVSDDGAITSGNTMTMNPIHHAFKDIALLGDGYSDFKHALLCQAGSHIEISDLFMYNWFHGAALRAGFVNASGIYAYRCGGSSVIVKAASGGNDTIQFINVDNVIVEGTDDGWINRAGPIYVQSFDSGSVIQHVNISNVTSKFGLDACVKIEKLGGVCSNITVVNAKATRCGFQTDHAAFDVVGADDVRFIGCDAVESAGIGYRTTGQRTQVFASAASFSGSSDYSGAFDYLELNGVVLENILDNVNLAPNNNARRMRQVMEIAGSGDVAVSQTKNALSLRWTGASGGYSALAVDLHLTMQSGGHSTFRKFRIAAERPGATTIEAAVAEDGTALVSGAGSQGSITVAVNRATADTLLITFTGVTTQVYFGYTAKVITDGPGTGFWDVRNLAT